MNGESDTDYDSAIYDEQELKFGDLISFDIDNPDVLRRLSIDVYDGITAGFRELITNGTTAIRDAYRQDYIDKSEGTLRVVRNDSERKLIIEDNGVGMTEERIDKIVTRIGRSTSRDNIESTGRFGMGFLATFILTGFDGAFKMKTKSRKTDKSITGYWTNKGFYKTDEKSDNTYGTRFEIPLDIDTKRLNHELEKHVKYPRVTTKYEHYNEDNKLVTDEEWNGYDSIINGETITVENEFVEVIMSDDWHRKKFILMDAPVSVNNWDSIPSLPCQIIVMKQEESVIVEGDNKGKILKENPTNDNHISRSELSDNDIFTPKPVGTRDKVENVTDDFTEWLEEIIIEQVKNTAINGEEQTQALKFLYKNGLKLTEGKITDKVVQKKFIKDAKGINIVKHKKFNNEFEYCNFHDKSEVLSDDVYMGSRIDEKKMHTVWNDDGDVLHVSNSRYQANETYRYLKSYFGWCQISNYQSSSLPDMSNTVEIYTDEGDAFSSRDSIKMYKPNLRKYFDNVDETIVVTNCEPKGFYKLEDVLESNDEDLITELDFTVSSEEYAEQKLDDDLYNADTVYYGDYTDKIDSGNDSTVYRDELSYEDKKILKYLESAEVKEVDKQFVFNKWVDSVEDEKAKYLLNNITVSSDMSVSDIEELIERIN